MVYISLFFVVVFPLWLLASEDLNTLAEKQSLCPFKLVTGFPCPGCGITKSLVFLYSGDIVQSIQFHLFGPVLIFGFFLLIVFSFFEPPLKNKILKSFVTKKIGLVLAFTLGIYHFYRLVVYIHLNDIDSILRESIWK